MEKTYGITAKDKFGYAMGDLGMQFVFGLIQSVLQKYYTDLLKIPVALVMVLFIAARVWDAVNDPLWGMFVDSRPKNSKGRYRRWVKYLCIPMAVSAVLLFVKLPGLSPAGYFLWACFTYVGFGMIYTGVNVPYGSMASVITSSDSERSSLSVFRSVGSAVGTVPAIVLISLCYVNIDGKKTMSYPKILTGVIIISFCSVIACLLCNRWTTERIDSTPKEKRPLGEVWKTVFKILKCRPFIIASLCALLLLAASVFGQSYYSYLFACYFDAPALTMLPSVCQYIPVAFVMIFVGKWIKKFGRKELCAMGMLLAGLSNLVLFFVQTVNPWFFLIMCFISGIGNAFMFLQVWALATEVIDYNKIRNGINDEAISYSVFSFIRKLGHVAAGILVNASLLQIGYSTENLTPEALHGMYNDSVLIPAVLYILVALLLWFAYPLNKKELQKLQEEKHSLESV